MQSFVKLFPVPLAPFIPHELQVIAVIPSLPSAQAKKKDSGLKLFDVSQLKVNTRLASVARLTVDVGVGQGAGVD